MNVGLSIHNLVVVGVLAAIFSLLVKLAANTPLGQLPVIGDGLQLLAH